ncbi:helix-turn-helix domain-containing protein [Streptomyces sp. NPDC002520]
MQELVGRLTALDPEASDSLKVIAYFDALVASGVGLGGLLRAAAALSGAIAGAERRGRITRCDPSGRRLDPSPDVVRSPERASHDVRVWLERDGAHHANDEMVVERLGIAVELLNHRGAPDNALDIVVDANHGIAERTMALARLHLNAGTRIRIVATGVDQPRLAGPSTVVPTRYGMLCATLDASGKVEPAGRAGLGLWVRADHAPQSWAAAVIAYRLSDVDDPVLDATEFGAMLRLIQAYDPEIPHEDIATLRRLDTRTSAILRTLVEIDSIRAAAERLGMHHSTVQARHAAITRKLGYDPRTPLGRMRYIVAAILLRLTDRPTD